jgi:hypothetical protein
MLDHFERGLGMSDEQIEPFKGLASALAYNFVRLGEDGVFVIDKNE